MMDPTFARLLERLESFVDSLRAAGGNVAAVPWPDREVLEDLEDLDQLLERARDLGASDDEARALAREALRRRDAAPSSTTILDAGAVLLADLAATIGRYPLPPAPGQLPEGLS